VDIFVEKTPLTRQSAFNDAGFDKLPVQKAKNSPNKINDLVCGENFPQIFLKIFFSARFVHK
jgi:hypothetical protein